MIFIANALPVNGGTTFLIRACRELHRRGQQVAVLVMFPIVDPSLRAELERYARVFDLADYLVDRGILMRAQLMTFAPVRWKRLVTALAPYSGALHVMGVFGLLFASRLARYRPGLAVTIGVYHQNEFLFQTNEGLFVRYFRRLFAAVPRAHFLFFNEANARNYARFFGSDFSAATIAPIGIDIVDQVPGALPSRAVGKLVSVGNLVNFKTYNRHIIRIISELADRFPSLHYDIYGSGPEEAGLKELASELNVQERVVFHGPMAYRDFAHIVAQSTLFIGSGTALLEAGALGVPAMVGIESIKQPETYGLLADIEGFSYNEYLPDVKRVPMRDIVERVLEDASYGTLMGQRCRTKALSFSVETTMDALTALTRAATVPLSSMGAWSCARVACSFVALAALDVLGLSATFRNRRDQSYGLT